MPAEANIIQLRERLAEKAETFGVSLRLEQQQQMIQYLQMLERWNKVFNLTAVRQIAQMLIKHVLDSLVLVPHLPPKTKRLIDVGTGAGLPGVILAIACPEIDVTLLDSQHKKTCFLVQVKQELKLANITIKNARMEAYQPDEKFDVVTCRGVAALDKFTKLAQHLLTSEGHFLAMKGLYPEEEIAALGESAQSLRVEALSVPMLNAERHLVIYQPGEVNGR